MPGNEVDETSRSYQQLMQMLVHLAYQYARTRQRLPKMTREQYRQFQRDLEERVRLDQYDRTNAQAWYTARVADYQREASVLAHGIAAGDFSIDEESRRRAFLDGMRADIEHSVHTVHALSPEERGQIVQALDQIEADPRVRFEHGVFPSMTKREQASARQAAARSEAATIDRQEQQATRLVATEYAVPADGAGSVAALKKANAALTKQVQQLTAENTALQTQVATLEAQAAAHATAQASTNGQHSATGQQQADQHAQQTEQQTKQRAAEADIDPGHSDGQAQMEAEA
ncbi:Uncharacterised protein [Nocardia otitidiscaviarum]|uniref:Uncharacterized protein n=1 Tax=Nocardia otitidiscaviarum TaxID=1823 RepID=A0A378YTC3_9NOCA|nr:hypothetical protein [Nocardia otitidiscaviarum]SUA80416.1 Uncharacterised protein [Nocardia otitidiscaviarum]